MNQKLSGLHHPVPSWAFTLAVVVAPLAASGCLHSTDVVARYHEGVITRRQLEKEQSYRRGRPTKSSFTHDVEAIVLRRQLSEKMRDLPRISLELCQERLNLIENQVAETELQKFIDESSQPTETEVREYFEKNRGDFHRPKQWRLRNVFVRAPTGSSDEERKVLRKRLEAALRDITTEEEFADLARSMSDSPTASRGGRIGFVTPSQLLPEATAALRRLHPGQLSNVIETEDGFTVLFCSEIRKERSFHFDEVRTSISSNIRQENRQALWDAVDREVKRRTKPELFIDAVDANDSSTVLRLRTSMGTIQVSRATYFFWIAQNGGRSPLSWSLAIHENALLELALVYGRADEARRRGLTSGEEYEDRRDWEIDTAAAECVLDIESHWAISPPTDSEITAIFEENRNRFMSPSRRDLEVLTVSISSGDPPRQFRELERLAEQIRTGTRSFMDVLSALRAQDHEASYEMKRDLPPMAIHSLGRNTAEAVLPAAAGEIVGPIQEGLELKVYRVEAIRPKRQLTLEEAAPRIRSSLEAGKLSQARRDISAAILAEQNITYY